MTERAQVEREIRNALATATQAIPLSNVLFSPTGLFNQLAATPEERKVLAQSALFREAQRRVNELQRKEAAEFARAVHQARSAMPPEGGLFKLESADNS